RPRAWPAGPNSASDDNLLAAFGLEDEVKLMPAASSGAFLLVPTCAALQKMHHPANCLGFWLQSRLVGPQGRWVELQYCSQEWPRSGRDIDRLSGKEADKVQQFFAQLRWQPGGDPSELLSRPLPEWDNWDERSCSGGVLFCVGFGRLEWDGCQVMPSALGSLADWLGIPKGAEVHLWRALLLAAHRPHLSQHAAAVEASCGLSLARAAAASLRVLRHGERTKQISSRWRRAAEES
ncbi:unnamed protein product, partial [Polarella glacialis]